jgi:hypothetical protein
MKTQKCENDQVSFHCSPSEAIETAPEKFELPVGIHKVLSPVTFNFSKKLPRAKRLRLINVLDNLLIFEGY